MRWLPVSAIRKPPVGSALDARGVIELREDRDGARRVGPAARDGRDRRVGGHAADPVVLLVGDQHLAAGHDGDARRLGEPRRHRRPAVAAEPALAGPGDDRGTARSIDAPDPVRPASAIKNPPAGSTASPVGRTNSIIPAATGPVVAEPPPATLVMTPARSTSRMRPCPVSAIRTRPSASVATSLGSESSAAVAGPSSPTTQRSRTPERARRTATAASAAEHRAAPSLGSQHGPIVVLAAAGRSIRRPATRPRGASTGFVL